MKFTQNGGCPVFWVATAIMWVAPLDRGAGLTQLKSGVWSAFLGICRPVPPVRGRGFGLKRM